jgi:hypothetical protein
MIKGERCVHQGFQLLGSPHQFAKHGKSGAELSTLLPHLAGIADQVAFVKSMHTTQFNHAPAQVFMNTGHQIIGRPSLGSWLTYGIGSENSDLPGFVVLLSGQNQPDGGKSCWGSGFLPTVYQGVEFRSQSDPVLFLSNPDGVGADTRRRSLNLLREMNQTRRDVVGDPELTTRIAAYEMIACKAAFRTDRHLEGVPEHPPTVRNRAGRPSLPITVFSPAAWWSASSFVQLHRGWDTWRATMRISSIARAICREPTKHQRADIRLKRRGLESTLVVWVADPDTNGQEQQQISGRDHPRALAVTGWGGSVGVAVGSTDDIGYNVAADRSVNLHATLPI